MTGPTRRIRVDVQLAGGRVRLDLTEPTDVQLAEINRLLEKWLDDAETEQPSAPAQGGVLEPSWTFVGEQGPEPVWRCEDGCGFFFAKAAYELHRLAEHQQEAEPPAEQDVAPTPAEAASGNVWRCEEPGCDAGPFTRPQALGAHRRYKHGPATAGRQAAIADPGDAVAVQLGDAAPLADQITEHAATADRTPPPAGVVLCACGHGERMHERDELVGRGQCHSRDCGCAEYRAAA